MAITEISFVSTLSPSPPTRDRLSPPPQYRSTPPREFGMTE